MEGGWTGLSPVGVPDSVVSRCPDGTQLEVLRATGAKDKEVGACHGEAMSAMAQGAGRMRWAAQEPQGTEEGRKETGQGNPVTCSVYGQLLRASTVQQ